MAARRLLIVMLILLGLSTLAAALVPPQSLREGTTTGSTTETTETTPPKPRSSGALRELTISVGGNRVPLVTCPRERRRGPGGCRPIEVGDELRLKVTSRRFAQLSVPAFGLLKVSAPPKPAFFDLLFQEPGIYQVLFAPSKKVAARIEVEKRRRPGAKSGARAGSDRA
jgi:hypothetical protein